eukprot:scaffold46705_cov36-Phaeocystis_antarctica.AAC.5
MAIAHRRPPTLKVFLRYATMTFRLDMYALMLVGCGSLLHEAADRPSAVSSCSRMVTAPTTRFLSPKRPGSVTSAQMYAFLGCPAGPVGLTEIRASRASVRTLNRGSMASQTVRCARCRDGDR